MEPQARIRLRRGDVEVEVEGSQGFVEREAGRLEGKWFGESPGAQEGVEARNVPAPAKGTRLKQFVELKRPKGHLEIAVVVALWARENQHKAALSGEELGEHYKLAEAKRPADAGNVMAKAASLKGWFESVGDGRYALTSAGEDFVRIDLPATRK